MPANRLSSLPQCWTSPMRRRRDRSFSCASLFATESFAARMRPSAQPFRPPKGCRRTRSSIAGVPSFSIHLLLGSAGFHQPPRYYEEIRLLHGRRPVVVASFGSTAHGGPMQTSLGNDTGCPAAPAPITAPASSGFWASRSKTRWPGRPGLLRGSLTFGAAVRLGLLPHTASRRQRWRLTTAGTACSCLRLAVATTSPREGLSPPIQCPCQAHLRSGYALSPERQRRRILFLVVALPCPRRIHPAQGGQYWTRKGVAIGRDLTAKIKIHHPSDDLGAVLAATAHAGGSGKGFLTQLSVADRVEAALTAADAPFRAHGFNSTTQLTYSLGAGGPAQSARHPIR